MVLRNKRINRQANEIMLSVSYGLPDIKKMIQWIFLCYYYKDCDWLLNDRLSTPHTEQEILELFKLDPKCFGNYEEKWANPLSEWAFNFCLREKYIFQSASNDNHYFFTDLCVPKKTGRPRKK